MKIELDLSKKEMGDILAIMYEFGDRRFFNKLDKEFKKYL